MTRNLPFLIITSLAFSCGLSDRLRVGPYQDGISETSDSRLKIGYEEDRNAFQLVAVKEKNCHEDIVALISAVSEEHNHKIQKKCFSVKVPKSYKDSSEGRTRLDAIIIEGNDKNARPLILQYASQIGLSNIEEAIRIDHMFKDMKDKPTIIAIDQRGSKYASNYITCKSDELSDCGRQDRHHVHHASSPNIARDIFYGAIVLTNGKIPNFYGLGYGAIVGQHFGNLFGNRVDKIILDGALELDWDHKAQAESTLARTIGNLLKICSEFNGCNAYDSNLSPMAALEKIRDKNTANLITASDRDFTHRLFIKFMQKKLSDVKNAEYVFSMLSEFLRAAKGKTTVTNEADEMLDFLYQYEPKDKRELQSERIYCGEFYGSVDDYDYEEQREELCEKVFSKAKSFSSKKLKFESDTLIVSGKFDPYTAVHHGNSLEKALPNAKHRILNNVGHGAIESQSCVAKMVLNFLKSKPLDQNCGNDLTILSPEK